jgi:hypothetical protein
VTLDFTEAGLRLITRPGNVVDAGDISMHGGSVTLPEPPGPGVPVLLRVEITGWVRGTGITAGPPRGWPGPSSWIRTYAGRDDGSFSAQAAYTALSWYWRAWVL